MLSTAITDSAPRLQKPSLRHCIAYHMKQYVQYIYRLQQLNHAADKAHDLEYLQKQYLIGIIPFKTIKHS